MDGKGEHGNARGVAGAESGPRGRSSSGANGSRGVHRLGMGHLRMGHLGNRLRTPEFSLAAMERLRYSPPMDTRRIGLEVGVTDLSIGEYSVGLAPSRTSEQLVEAYIELVTLVRRDHPEYLRDEDLDILAVSTGLDTGFLRNRVTSQVASLRVA